MVMDNRLAVRALVVTWVLALAAPAAHAEDNSSLSSRLHRFGEVAKHDSAVAGAAVKRGAHRAAVAAKAVGHEIAAAAKRSAAETRAAFKDG